MNEAERGNEYLGRVAESEDLTENRKQHEKRLTELREKGIAKLTIYQKFEMADLAAEYRTIYGFMSAHSHVGLQSLIDRHIGVSDGRPQVSAFVDRPIESLETYLGTTCEIFMLATELFHNYFESDLIDDVRKLREIVNEHKKTLR
jgi:hypothetical protein